MRILAYRIGVDVGGTFTDAAALDCADMSLVGSVKVPTTHRHPNGVAEGIRIALTKLMDTCRLRPEDVVFIAHGTTQATNALLEGDVAPVGVISTGEGLSAGRVKSETAFDQLPLSAGKSIPVRSIFLRQSQGLPLQQALDALQAEGIRSIVAASAYSVDRPGPEQEICAQAAARGFSCSMTHEMSSLYGLRTRTKTAIINASILPKMVQTVNFMARSVRDVGIERPLMIMRSDGGVMNAAQVSRHPVQTILSGPSAGVAGALLYGRVSEGIFLEVGGTSTDISAVHNGRVALKWAQIGGHKTYVNSLDIRTEAIAGGSMLRVENGRASCGPRSAHIAGAEYCCFAKDMAPERLRVEPFRFEEDPAEYLILRDTETDKIYALTLTCLANCAGLVPPGDFSAGDRQQASAGLEAVAAYLQKSAETVLEEVFSSVCGTLVPLIQELAGEHHLPEGCYELFGGGGGCCAVVPILAERMGLKWRPVPNAPLISTLGVAMAMVREVSERILSAPTEAELQALREEAVSRAVRAGAVRDRIAVIIEQEPLRNLVRAVASGVTDGSQVRDTLVKMDVPALREKLAQDESLQAMELAWDGGNDRFHIFWFREPRPRWQALFRTPREKLFVMAADGTIKLRRDRANVQQTKRRDLEQALRRSLDEYSDHGDAGERIPKVYLLAADRLLDYSSLQNREQILRLARVELDDLDPEEDIFLLFVYG